MAALRWCALLAMIAVLVGFGRAERQLRARTREQLLRPPFSGAASQIKAREEQVGQLSTEMHVEAARGVFNVVSFGAAGDGSSDDTAAINSAVAALVANGTGVLYFPTGKYVVSSTIAIDASQLGPTTIEGDGFGSMLLHGFDADLFSFQSGKGQVAWLTMRSLAIVSTIGAKSPATTAVAFTGGVVKSLFSGLLVMGSGGIPGDTRQTFSAGTAFDLGNVTDTVGVRDCVVWDHLGTAVRIGRGSEVRIEGGRMIGLNKPPQSIGVHVTGNNGGVHVISTDLIGNNIGMRLDSSNGAGSNREIFLNHATIDSNWRGLSVFDDSYVSIAGCWTASSNADNIWTAVGSDPLIVIAGGTIFNAGAEGGDPSQGECNGITANGGSFSLSGVAVRNNKGTGIWVPNSAVSDFVVSGCKIFGNGVAVDIGDNSGYLIAGNQFASNAKLGNFGSKAGGAVVANNVGVPT